MGKKFFRSEEARSGGLAAHQKSAVGYLTNAKGLPRRFNILVNEYSTFILQTILRAFQNESEAFPSYGTSFKQKTWEAIEGDGRWC